MSLISRELDDITERGKLELLTYVHPVPCHATPGNASSTNPHLGQLKDMCQNIPRLNTHNNPVEILPIPSITEWVDYGIFLP